LVIVSPLSSVGLERRANRKLPSVSLSRQWQRAAAAAARQRRQVKTSTDLWPQVKTTSVAGWWAPKPQGSTSRMSGHHLWTPRVGGGGGGGVQGALSKYARSHSPKRPGGLFGPPAHPFLDMPTHCSMHLLSGQESRASGARWGGRTRAKVVALHPGRASQPLLPPEPPSAVHLVIPRSNHMC